MKVLVTGGAGYIGSHTAQGLLQKGYSVVVLDNLTTGFLEAVPSGAEFIRGDVRDEKLVDTIIREKKIDSIIHFAAKLVVPESIEKPLEYYENNIGGVLTLLKACRINQVKNFIFSSTAAVYGNSTKAGMIDEEAPVAPLNPYGQSKYMSECLLFDAAKAHGFGAIALRYFNVAGAAENGSNGQRTKVATHLIKVASQAAVGKKSCVSVYGSDYRTSDGTGVRDYIHVEDLADIHVLALEKVDRDGESGIYNCGYGKGYSVLEVLKAVKNVSGTDFKVEYAERRPGDADSLVADNSKLRNTFKWEPKRANLDIICKTAFEWEKKYDG